MTEDEAKTKWCPFAASRSVSGMVVIAEQHTANYLGPETGKLMTLCVGSGCMAWRVTNQFPSREARIDAIKRYRIEHGASLQEAKPLFDQQGYCGLAGKP